MKIDTQIYKCDKKGSLLSTDSLAVESPLEISVALNEPSGGTSVEAGLTMRTPGMDEQLSLGFLFTEGIISAREQVKKITLVPKPCHGKSDKAIVQIGAPFSEIATKLKRRTIISAACGVCGKLSSENLYLRSRYKLHQQFPQVTPKTINSWPADLLQWQRQFQLSGGLHAVGLVNSSGKIIFVAEDIGRHNAMDKVIGFAFQQNLLPLLNFSVLLSGRAGFELIQKAQVAGVPIVGSIGAPSNLAFEMASSFGQTLIGFIRNDRFNVYCGKQRIKESLH